jgi:hypothetical protein
MGRGMAKQAYDDPVKFVATCALAEVVMGGVAKGVGKVSRAVTKTVGTKTGLIRTKALGSEVIPYKEAGAILDELRYNKQTTGMHASPIRDLPRKKVFQNAPSGISSDPSTFGKTGRFATVSDPFTDTFGEYFLNKSNRRPIAPRKITDGYKTVKSKVTQPIKNKLVKTETSFNEYGGVVKKTSFRNAKLQSASNKLNAFKETKVGKLTKKAARVPKENYAKNKAKFTNRKTIAKDKIVERYTTDNVKLTDAQWNRVYKQFQEKGNFWDEYQKITNIAQRQADKTGKPVAIPSPKVAKGMMEAENEVFLIFPKKGVKVTSKLKIGKTPSGIDVYEVRYGKQAPVIKKSLSQRMKENMAYNQQMVKAVDGKKYNLNHIKSYANDANRRLGELYGGKTTRPGAYEYGSHGKAHTEQVGKNVSKQAKPKAEETDYWLGVMHDVTKIGSHETAGIPHAVAAAEVIKRGMITDARFNRFFNSLSKAKQAEFVKAIGEHTTIKPINKHLITEVSKHDILHPVKSVKERAGTLKAGVKTAIKDKPTVVSKALANADRLDLERFGTKPKKSMMFDLKNNPAKPKVKLSERVKSGLSAKNAKAKIEKAKMGIKTKARTTKKPTKTYTEGYKKPSYKPSYKPYAAAKSYGANIPKAATYTEFMRGAESIYKLGKSEKAYKPTPKAGKSTYTAPKPYTKKYTPAKGTYKPVSKPYSKPYTAPVNKPYVKPYTKPVNKPYVKPYTNPVNKPYVKPYVAPGTKPYVKPYVAPETTPYKSATGGGGYKPIPSEQITPTPLYKRKKAQTVETGKTGVKYKTAHRTRKNVLGDMESFFGGSNSKAKPVKKPVAKKAPVKRAAPKLSPTMKKKTTAKQTVKRKTTTRGKK